MLREGAKRLFEGSRRGRKKGRLSAFFERKTALPDVAAPKKRHGVKEGREGYHAVKTVCV